MGDHGGQVDPAVLHQVEVVLDGVLSHPLELLDGEGVGPDDGQLLEVDRRVLPPTRGWRRRCRPACPARPAPAPRPRGSRAWPPCRRPRRCGRGGPWAGRRRRYAARRRTTRPGARRGLRGARGRRPPRPRRPWPLAPGPESGPPPRPRPAGRGRGGWPRWPGRARRHPKTRTLAAGPGRVAHDGVEGNRERVGQDGGLVGDVVGHREQHGGMGGQELGPGPRGVGDHPDVDARAEVAVGE